MASAIPWAYQGYKRIKKKKINKKEHFAVAYGEKDIAKSNN